MKLLHYWSLVIVLVFISTCTSSKNSPPTLSLKLAGEGNYFRLVDYKVLEKGYEKSQQQGQYQAHLLDDSGKVLQKVSFDKIQLSPNGKESSPVFYVSLPLLPAAQTVTLYQLDGSSGHYQLNEENVRLNWQIPDTVSLRKKAK